ncbi:hypothetical protein KSF_108840 [Reticulibacter mediterranei]|uniref:Mannosyl-glycoprotein endo-beta-N-acetylglucosamidase-like domain-containing protein n=1 Tax=Reticulibacter mediterranei TaxID=2778369 RepID=A0A8J3J510_9CHLR|nr:glucosaminidase domain-containing protein [Reticulibacter mediterranei]GHP00837.1 hypothetical protein KSF_108840 [Reticulibacter mediterranei]
MYLDEEDMLPYLLQDPRFQQEVNKEIRRLLPPPSTVPYTYTPLPIEGVVPPYHAPRHDLGEQPQASRSSFLPAIIGLLLLIVVGSVLGQWYSTATRPPIQQARPTPPYTLFGPPSITATFINQVLDRYHSPAVGKGQTLYDLGVKYGIDPVFALAFFMHESSFGTQGEATSTLALGNERCIPDRPCIDQDRGGYAQMYSWEDGFEQWYQLISGPVYKGSGRTTVDTIIPRYAPSADNNDEAAYIAAIKHAVSTWRTGTVIV